MVEMVGVDFMRKVVVPVAFLFCLVGCSSSPSNLPRTVAAAEARPQPSPTPTAHSTATLQMDFVASGPIIVEDQVDVAAQRDGVIADIFAEPGTSVKKGQLLAKMDDRQVSAELEAARAKTRSMEADLKNWQAEAKVLQADYARAEKMWQAQIIPKEQLEHAKYKAESDEWDVKRVSELLANSRQVEHSLELELEKTRITAPFHGVVARRYIRSGQSVTKNDRLFWVTAVAPLRIRVTLPERFLGHIRPGTMVGITPLETGDASHRYRARVIQVSPVVDPASDTIEILAELSGDTSGLRPGMRADLRLPDVR
jgi:RND family efflux transporter MFP subunit